MSNHNLNLETAEAYIVDSVLLLLQTDSVGSAKEKLIKDVENFDTISYVYVVNKSNKLIGILSVQELFAAKNSILIKDVMIDDVVTVRPNTHKEKVALIALKHHLKSIPIVDKLGIFKGVVPSDAILSILSNAHLEDDLLSAGIHSPEDSMQNITNTSVSYHLKNRFPWLVLGLSGMMLTTFVIGAFDDMLEKQILLATFMPAIVYMSDAAGTQTQTIFIKAMTLDNKINFLFYFMRETKIALALGMVLSTIVFIVSSLVWKSPIVSFIFAFSLLMAILGAAIMAIILPILLKKIKIDPAVASGPLASVIRDTYSLSIYLIFASILLRLFG